MILLLPEAKHVVEKQGRTKPFRAMRFAEDAAGFEAPEAQALRFRLRRARFEKIQHILVLDDLLNLPHGF